MDQLKWMMLMGSGYIKPIGGLSEITRIKSHELMFLNCNLEGDFLLENIFMQNQLNIWFG